MIPGIDRVETLDASWLSRGSGGGGMRALMEQARGWRTRDYDLAINFEGDIRSHLLVALSGATERAGFTMAGGGPLLTRRFEFDPRQHTTRRTRCAAGDATPSRASGESDGAAHAISRLRRSACNCPRSRANARRRCVGREPRVIALHASGGRAIKQWPLGAVRRGGGARGAGV